MFNIDESRAIEIACDYARKIFRKTPFVEHEDGFMTAEDTGNGIIYISKPDMTFVPQEQANYECKFRAVWIASFHQDWYMSPSQGQSFEHSRFSIFIDAETGDIWEKQPYQKPAAQDDDNDLFMFNIDESRAMEIACDYARKRFHEVHKTPFIEDEHGFRTAEDTGDEIIYISKPHITFVPKPSTTHSLQAGKFFRPGWFASFFEDFAPSPSQDWIYCAHSRFSIFIDAETGETWKR